MTNLPFNGNFKMTCEYGRKGSWSAGYHTGVDLVGISSINVYNVCNGQVIMAKSYGSYGNCVKVRDKETGKIFLYAHLKSISVQVGQWLSRTSKIGVMGSTGNSSGPHLHFEVRTKEDVYGKQENPCNYLGIPNKVGTYNSTNYQIKSINYQCMVQDKGWQEMKYNGAISGTTGESKRIEAIKVHTDCNIKYRVHSQDIGWSEWQPKDVIVGKLGKRIEAIEIVTDGTCKIKAQAHVEGLGWMDSVIGDIVKIGTEGKSLRLEAFKLEIV